MSPKISRSPTPQRLGERVLADDVAGHAGLAAEDVAVRHARRARRRRDRRPVGHLQHVRHVAARRRIEDGDVLLVAMDADDAGHQVAGIDDQPGAGLQDHLDVELGAERLDGRDQRRDVIAGLVDEVPAAEIHGLDALEVGRELARDMLGSARPSRRAATRTARAHGRCRCPPTAACRGRP